MTQTFFKGDLVQLTEQKKALLAEADRAMLEAEALKAEERPQVIEQIKAIMAEWDIKVADLGMREAPALVPRGQQTRRDG